MSLSMGQIIKDLRKKNGLTQAEFAELLGITYQAVSKWENDTGMPDISQIVPIASIFKVSTDVLFGIADTTEHEEVWNLVKHANSIKKFGELETYLNAYEILLNGLKKYPNNLFIMDNCINLGVSLCLPENGWSYTAERALEITYETIRQANYVIANSKHIPSILSAHQTLVLLYCNKGNFDAAINAVDGFPHRADFTLCSNYAIVKEYMKDYKGAARFLCTDIDYMLQALENNLARLGKAYYNDGKFADAITVYETFFEIMSKIFKDEVPPSYHDFDSGDCYLLLAEAYLAVGETGKAINAVEKSVMYYIDLYNMPAESRILLRNSIKSPIIRETDLRTPIPKEIIKQKLLYKLSENGIQSLKQETRFIELLDVVNNLS